MAPLPAPAREVALAGRPSPGRATSCRFSACLGGEGASGPGGDPQGPGQGLRAPALLRSLAPPAAPSDPDNVVLCLLAADEDDDRDVALQIHFTLIQAFCCENDINILRVSNPGRLAELLLLETDAGPAASEGAEQPPDLHCVLVTVRDWGTAACRVEPLKDGSQGWVA